jgi:hypothetical protein
MGTAPLRTKRKRMDPATFKKKLLAGEVPATGQRHEPGQEIINSVCSPEKALVSDKGEASHEYAR